MVALTIFHIADRKNKSELGLESKADRPVSARSVGLTKRIRPSSCEEDLLHLGPFFLFNNVRGGFTELLGPTMSYGLLRVSEVHLFIGWLPRGGLE